MAHHEPEQQNLVRERLVLPVLLPLAALLGTVVLVVIIGEILLSMNETHYNIAGQEIVLPVFVSLAMAVVVLIAATAAIRMWASDDE